jgi:hypothetical protein
MYQCILVALFIYLSSTFPQFFWVATFCASGGSKGVVWSWVLLEPSRFVIV